MADKEEEKLAMFFINLGNRIKSNDVDLKEKHRLYSFYIQEYLLKNNLSNVKSSEFNYDNIKKYIFTGWYIHNLLF